MSDQSKAEDTPAQSTNGQGERMSDQSKAEETPAQSTNGQEERNGVARGWGFVDSIKEQYRKTKEHAEAYPYVWGSYILVYGGLGLWFTYRFRKLRQTEDRVRILQKEILKQYEAEESAEAAKAMHQSTESSIKPLPPADKAAKKE